MLDRRAGGTEVIGAPHKWLAKTNWKYPVDNFGGDDGHHVFTHASLRKVDVDTMKYATNVAEQYSKNVQTREVSDESLENPERAIERILSSTPEGPIRDYVREHFPEAVERLGKEAYRPSVVDSIFPNFSVNGGRQMLRVWHPRGPCGTEIWTYCIV